MRPRFHLRSLMLLVLVAALVMAAIMGFKRMDFVLDRTEFNHLAILIGAASVLAISKIRVAFALRHQRHRPPDLEPLDSDPIRPRTGG